MHTSKIFRLAASALLALHAVAAEKNQSHTDRSDSLQALCARLNVGPDAVVADVGCGDGPDTMVFAGVVGEGGTVLAQEIDSAKLKKVVETADKRGFHQVVPVLGQSDDPRLPNGFADLIYMNRVFHHFSRPQAMLQRLWQDLTPGGFLVVVDQQKGPLTDWTALDNREKQHHWTGETTVVRVAREAGFLFHDVLDDLWHEKAPFVLAFRKPAQPPKAIGDPDLPRPLDEKRLLKSLPLAQTQGTVAFFGLDCGRAVLPTLRQTLSTSNRVFDILLDEWALSREELPAQAPVPGTEILRADKGNVSLPAGVQLGLVLFADSYHRLWEPVAFLRRLKVQMAASAWVAIVERNGPEGEPRRLANHRRRLSPKTIVEEMRQAGFHLQRTRPAPAKDRFFLLFAPDTLPGR